jgi:hypothetical protein
MEDEVVIIEVEPKITGFDNFDCEPGTTSAICNYEKELYEVNQPVTCRPTYLAIRGRGGNHVQLLFEIDQVKSIFEKGQIVPKGKPIKGIIFLQLNDKSPTSNIIWYTSFRTLLTHNSTEEFVEEKSKPFTRVIVAENRKILCNGYSCNHIAYCKFFNHSPSAILKTEGQSFELR